MRRLTLLSLLLSGLALGLAAVAAEMQSTPQLVRGVMASAPAATTVASPVAIQLSLSKREISLVRDGKLVSRWPVVIGAPETPTPTGAFQVVNKVVNPVYASTSTGKVKGVGALGYRWIGFHKQGPNDFGIHGTPWPWWVDARAAVSHGCVRMRNEHVDKLFSAVEIGTPLIIKP
ncbi:MULTISPECIES: L,D-transpeptidase [unclassified Synechococcus]|jgi:lipoprotein-anchoring transpeptidase ErfK/SrfK|uniref:L,D-transpeptidase n=1 Tax=unclassified Synechococcus TaxID=2626047 RepID=UPI0020CD3062|nr:MULTISPECIES: L,D-transpeptidase [unclassified Synechococcus]